MLRIVLLWVGVLAVAAGAVVSFVSGAGAGIGLLIFGLVLLVVLLIERHRYKRIVDAAPGPEWEPTGERFIEPGAIWRCRCTVIGVAATGSTCGWIQRRKSDRLLKVYHSGVELAALSLRAKRSNPARDCFASLAMTKGYSQLHP
jgi:hypothetical protein